jgi:hypothetical protein
MDGLALLADARAAGLSVSVDSDALVIRGPSSSEPVARKLLEEKSAVIVALRSTQSELLTAEPCPTCLSAIFWRDPWGGFHCCECLPPKWKALCRQKLMLVQPRGPRSPAEWRDYEGEMSLNKEVRGW